MRDPLLTILYGAPNISILIGKVNLNSSVIFQYRRIATIFVCTYSEGKMPWVNARK